MQINEEIRDKEVRLVSTDGEQLGIMSAKEALKKAEEKDLDLVKISPTANPPVLYSSGMAGCASTVKVVKVARAAPISPRPVHCCQVIIMVVFRNPSRDPGPASARAAKCVFGE